MTYNYNVDYNTAGAALGGLAAGILVFVGIIVLICLAIAILGIIGQWKILEKGGKPGWGALIPFYNTYLLCDMVGVTPWWILIVLGGSLIAFIPVIGSLLSLAVSIYFMVILNVSLARAFGKEDSYAIGLILLQPFFYFALGTGKNNEYKGKNPMEDKVWDTLSSKANSSSNADGNSKFCTSCGAKMDKKSSFCPSCGKEVK